LVEIAAGVLGTAATWVASKGSRAAVREAQTPRLLVGACERQVRVFFSGGRAALLGPRLCFRRRGPLGSLEPGARTQGGGGGGCARALAVFKWA
jgi:hypothetical protein